MTQQIVTTLIASVVACGLVAGCAADAVQEPSDPAPATVAAQAPSPAQPAKTGAARAVAAETAAAALPPGTADGRGALLGTVLASEGTSRDTGIAVWATFKQNGAVTTYGFSSSGEVVWQLAAQRGTGDHDIIVTAPSSGALHLAADGTVIENTFRASNGRALDAMSADYGATSENAAYGWFTWVRTGVFCAIAGACAGANVAADIACVEGGVELVFDD